MIKRLFSRHIWAQSGNVVGCLKMSLNMSHPRVGRPENTYPAGGACGEEFGRRKKGVGGGKTERGMRGFGEEGPGRAEKRGRGGARSG